MLDLLEIARVVHEFDRRQPKRTTGVRVKQVHVKMSLRAPARWTKEAKAELAEVLRVQGNAAWTFDFDQRLRGRRSGADKTFADHAAVRAKAANRPPSAVALFSGGLDSTSGLATMAKQARDTLLVGYYAQQMTKQQSIASMLGFPHLVQVGSAWATPETSGRGGGQFLYRSLLFLSLAAVVGDAAGTTSILQFENGPLALSVHPLPLYRMTRHAHPLVHLHLGNLLTRISGRTVAISNPFVAKTKGEAVAMLRANLSTEQFRKVVEETETCWYLNARTIIAGRKNRKENGVACGACVPCLVRRAALGGDETKTAVDFAADRGRVSDPVVRIHFDAYAGFASRLLEKGYSLRDFMEDVPAVTKDALSAAGPIDPQAAFDLYRRFAREWVRCFPRRRA